MQSLRKLLANQKQQPKQVVKDSDESPVNPYGAFIREAKETADVSIKLDIVVQYFEKGVLVTIIQGDKRKFSQFFRNDEEKELYAEEEYDGEYNTDLDRY